MTGSQKRKPDWIKVLIMVVIAAIGIFAIYKFAYEVPRAAAVDTIVTGITDDRAPLAKIVQQNYLEYRNNAKNWSTVAFSCIFLAAIFSAVAGLVLKLEFLKKKGENGDALQKDLAAILAVTASILIVISTNGDFLRKWQANRAAAATMENLAYDLLKEPFTAEDREAILTGIKAANLKRNLDIIGETKTDDNEKPANSNTTAKKPANTNTASNRAENSNRPENVNASSNRER